MMRRLVVCTVMLSIFCPATLIAQTRAPGQPVTWTSLASAIDNPNRCPIAFLGASHDGSSTGRVELRFYTTNLQNNRFNFNGLVIFSGNDTVRNVGFEAVANGSQVATGRTYLLPSSLVLTNTTLAIRISNCG